MRIIALIPLFFTFALLSQEHAPKIDSASPKFTEFQELREVDPYAVIDDMNCDELLAAQERKEQRLNDQKKLKGKKLQEIAQYESMGSFRKWVNEEEHQENLFAKKVSKDDIQRTQDHLQYIKKSIKEDCK